MSRHRVGPVETGIKSCYVDVYSRDGVDTIPTKIRNCLHYLGAICVDTEDLPSVGYRYVHTYRVPIKTRLVDTERILKRAGITSPARWSMTAKGEVCGKVNPVAVGSGPVENLKARKLSAFREKQKAAKVDCADPLPQSVLEACYPDGIPWGDLASIRVPVSSGGRNWQYENNQQWFDHCEQWKALGFSMVDYHCLCLSWSAFASVFTDMLQRNIDACGMGEAGGRFDALLAWIRVWLDSPEAISRKSDWLLEHNRITDHGSFDPMI